MFGDGFEMFWDRKKSSRLWDQYFREMYTKLECPLIYSFLNSNSIKHIDGSAFGGLRNLELL